MCVYLTQIAWALNKGVKQEYKQFWDVDLGVTYIPWEKVKLDDLDGLAEGGIIDQETVNDGEETSTCYWTDLCFCVNEFVDPTTLPGSYHRRVCFQLCSLSCLFCCGDTENPLRPPQSEMKVC